MGRREQQKQDRQQRILEAATLLFRNRGFEETHMETIAEQADLSVGALYNYYRSKGDLLAAIVTVEVTDVLKLGETVVVDPPEDVAEALDRLVSIYYAHSLVYLDKAMWREAIAITTRTPEAPSARVYTDLDRRLREQVATMLGSMKRTGQVAAHIDEGVAGALVFNNLDRMFQDFVRNEEMSLQALLAAVSAQHRLIANAIAP